MVFRLVVGLAMTTLALTIVGHRIALLWRLGRASRPGHPATITTGPEGASP
jgi:hypothetical protein